MRKAVFPGSFDPITKGHENVVRRGLTLFDEIIVAVGVHSSKRCMFSVDERVDMIRETFADESRVRVATYDGLTVDFCASMGVSTQLRGVRNESDLTYEQTIAQMTRAMRPEMDTVILLTDLECAAIHSTVVRDVLSHGGDVTAFVPDGIKHRFLKA